MAKKIFVSYKYGDKNVRALDNDYWGTTARKYVDKLEEIIGKNDIYKGENDGDDMSTLQDDSIWTNLKQKIFDSSITIVLISPGMKVSYKRESEQWIPQEVSYSLKEISHAGRKSRTNALICVVLPNSLR